MDTAKVTECKWAATRRVFFLLFGCVSLANAAQFTVKPVIWIPEQCVFNGSSCVETLNEDFDFGQLAVLLPVVYKIVDLENVMNAGTYEPTIEVASPQATLDNSAVKFTVRITGGCLKSGTSRELKFRSQTLGLENRPNYGKYTSGCQPIALGVPLQLDSSVSTDITSVIIANNGGRYRETQTALWTMKTVKARLAAQHGQTIARSEEGFFAVGAEPISTTILFPHISDEPVAWDLFLEIAGLDGRLSTSYFGTGVELDSSRNERQNHRDITPPPGHIDPIQARSDINVNTPVSTKVTTLSAVGQFDIVPCDSQLLIQSIKKALGPSSTSKVIQLSQGCTYTLTTVDNNQGGANGLPLISGSLTINGNGATIQRQNWAPYPPNFRIFKIASGANVTLRDMTILHGWGPSGAAISNEGTLTLERSTVSDNFAVDEARAGGIFNSGTLNIVNSTISGNWAAPDSFPGSKGRTGGGVWNSGILNVSFSTIANNHAEEGGGIYNVSATGVVQVKNSLIASNVSGGDCAGAALIGSGMNFDTDGTCSTGFVYTSKDKLHLGSLASNGGGAKSTHALLPGSVAIDSAVDCTTLASEVLQVDERGVKRPQGEKCDVGAFEAEPEPVLLNSLVSFMPQSRKLQPVVPTFLPPFPLPLLFPFLSPCGPNIALERFSATLSNTSQDNLGHLMIKVREITGGNTLLVDGRKLGTGGEFPVPMLGGYSDSQLTPRDSVLVDFNVCVIDVRRPFRLFVDVLGNVTNTP